MAGIAFALICIVIWLLPASAAGHLPYDRGAIAAGEWWRLWSGHAVHYTFSQLLSDAGMVALLGYAIENHFGRLRLALLLAAAPVVISVALYFSVPAMAVYSGASAMAAMLWSLGCCLVISKAPRISALFWLAIVFLVALLAKTAVEAAGLGPSFSTLPEGVQVAWPAHLFGALLGIAAFFFRETGSTKPAADELAENPNE
ncbi:MAG TPA: rhombosortase, partial [Mariprofundaceae bacterium]|nr:rhombosortase [Mariprofundaceae bacterium]